MKLATGSGALASIGLWAFDVLRVPDFDLTQEAKLVAVHALVGALVGALVALSSRHERSRLNLALTSSGLVVLLGLLALLAMVGTYPQTFADRWWLPGGFLAKAAVLVTHGIGPWALDVVAVGIVGSMALVSIARALQRWHRHSVTAAIGGVVAAGAIAAVAVRDQPEAGDGRPNVLLIVSGSLRADALEDPSTMPYLASRVSEGALYRYAVTPVARTYPSMVSMVTGTETRIHGVRHTFSSAEDRADVLSLFTRLRDEGYFTFLASDSEDMTFRGFETAAAPRRDVASLQRGATLHRHRFSLALLRFRWFRALFPEWRNVPLLADPEWVVDDTLTALDRARGRPFAGLVFFAAAEEPYLAPYPHYRRGAGSYRGRYLYHRSFLSPEAPATREDVAQIDHRYRGALAAVDRATERLLGGVTADTLVVVTGAHGETPGGARAGDTLESEAQTIPVLLLGGNGPTGVRSDAQVRLIDVPATVLERLGGDPTFGDGASLHDARAPRPACVETGLWLDPGDGGSRLDYPSVSELVTVDPTSGEMRLRPGCETLVESAKERGLVIGNRLYRERPTRNGIERETITLQGPAPLSSDVDQAMRFETRCVDGDERLTRLYGAIVFERREP